MSAIVKFENLKALIIELRGQSALLDSDVAELYGVETKAFNRGVRRNLSRFPQDFMFQLTAEEFEGLRFHFGTSKFEVTNWHLKARRPALSSPRVHRAGGGDALELPTVSMVTSGVGGTQVRLQPCPV